jgi:putative ABC transport system substrate-binding protein
MWALLGRPRAADFPSKKSSSVSVGLLATGHIEARDADALPANIVRVFPELGGHLTLVQREAKFNEANLPKLIDELMTLRPVVLVCMDLVSATVAKARLRSRGIDTPIVFLAHADPVANKLIDSYAHPGLNITGVSTYHCIDSKMLALLAETFPGRRRIGYLLDASDTSADDKACVDAARRNAARGNVELIPIDVSTPDFLPNLKARAASLRLEAILAPASAPIWQNRKLVVTALNELRLPVIYESDIFLAEGGLMSYGPIRTDSIPRLAEAVVRILRGTPAGDIPVDQPSLFEFVLNMQAPHFSEFGIKPTTLRRADRLLE